MFRVYIHTAVGTATPTRPRRLREIAEYGALIRSTDRTVFVNVESAIFWRGPWSGFSEMTPDATEIGRSGCTVLINIPVAHISITILIVVALVRIIVLEADAIVFVSGHLVTQTVTVYIIITNCRYNVVLNFAACGLVVPCNDVTR